MGESELTLLALPKVNHLSGLGGQERVALETAREHLRRVDVLLSAPELAPQVKAAATRFFLTPPEMLQSSLRHIRNVVTMTRTGLECDVTLKVGNIESKQEGKVVHGLVTNKDKPNTKSHHNQRERFGVIQRAGAIKISETMFDINGLPLIRVLIHEATHKYAGTNDYCYFAWDGFTPEGEFNKRHLALHNADSYTCFVQWLTV